MELLRFFTAGNVDDGKSTLIGRLLFDSNSISTDIIETLTQQSKTTGKDTSIDLALLTDGLRSEREQGITIDVAYKYFTTEKRKFIIADTPGHIQYTRNMFTGASNADLAIILVDARHGVTEQTKRHSILASILNIKHVVLCINKMDLIDFDQVQYNHISESYLEFTKDLNLKHITSIPTSAYLGDNVVRKTENLAWYDGPTLFEFLENVNIQENIKEEQTRFQVQYVIRPQTEELHDYRGYAGSVLSGTLSKGQRVQILPVETASIISKIEKNGKEIESAQTGEAIILHLEDDVDVSRGTTIVPIQELPETDNQFEATICWMDNKAFQQGQKLLLQQNSFRTKAVIKNIHSKLNINTNELHDFEGNLQLNDVVNINIKTAENVSFDAFRDNKKTGAFILINENTNNTVAAGVIR